MENRLRIQEKAAETRLKAKAMEEYKQKLDDRERWFNLMTEGKFRTEDDAFFEGGRDPFESAVYEHYRNKKWKTSRKILMMSKRKKMNY